MDYYLYKDVQGNNYEYARLLGVAHEIYCNECIRKGNLNIQEMQTKYAGLIIKATNQTGNIEACLRIPDKSIIDLPIIFIDRLKTLEQAQADGWFNDEG